MCKENKCATSKDLSMGKIATFWCWQITLAMQTFHRALCSLTKSKRMLTASPRGQLGGIGKSRHNITHPPTPDNLYNNENHKLTSGIGKSGGVDTIAGKPSIPNTHAHTGFELVSELRNSTHRSYNRVMEPGSTRLLQASIFPAQ